MELEVCSGEGCCHPAQPRPGAPWLHQRPWQLHSPLSLLFSALQDELSHINARLNMGILGCEYGPAASTHHSLDPHKSLTSFFHLQPTTLSRSSSAKGPLWATRALSGVSVSTPWVTYSSVVPLTRPSRWAGSCPGRAFSPGWLASLSCHPAPWHWADPAGISSDPGLCRCGTPVPPTSARRH